MDDSEQNKDSAKKRPRPSARSIANLKPTKKGEPSRNPLGAKLHNPLTRALKRVTQDSYCEALSIAFERQEDELEKFVNNPETPMLQKFVAKAMLSAFKRGDFAFVERIADRLIGKVSENMVINQTGAGNVVAQIAVMSDAEIKSRVAKLKEDV